MFEDDASPGDDDRSAPPWPVDEVEEALARPEVIAAIAAMLLNPGKWIMRRKEQLELEDATVAIRRMSATILVPRHMPTITVGGREMRILPLTYIRKRKLPSFDLRDERGAALALLPTSMGRTAARQVMLLLATQLFDLQGVRDAFTRTLDDLFEKSTEDKWTTAADEARTKAKVEAVMATLADRPLHPSVQELLTETGDPRAAVLSTYSTLLRRLALNLLCLILVPADQAGPMVLKYRLTEPVSFSRAAESWRHRVAMRLGWRPWQIFTPVPAAATSRRYHVEMKAPQGTEMLIGRIVALRATGTGSVASLDDLSRWSAFGSRVRSWLRRRETSPNEIVLQRLDREPKEVVEYPATKVHLAATMDTQSALKVYAVFAVRLTRRGWLRVSLLCCSVVTAVLLVLGLTADAPAKDGPPSPILIFLSLLTLATAMLTRSTEHPVATELLEGIRTGVTVVCASPVAASLAVLGFEDWDTVTHAFRLLGALCLVITALLLVTYARSMSVRKGTLHYVAAGVGGDPDAAATRGLMRAYHRRAAQMMLALRINEGWQRPTPAGAPAGAPIEGEPRRYRSVPYSIGVDTVRVAHDAMVSGIRIGTHEANRYALEDGWSREALIVCQELVDQIVASPQVIDLTDGSARGTAWVERVRRRLRRHERDDDA